MDGDINISYLGASFLRNYVAGFNYKDDTIMLGRSVDAPEAPKRPGGSGDSSGNGLLIFLIVCLIILTIVTIVAIVMYCRMKHNNDKK